MKKTFKVEAIYEGNTVLWAVYKKRFLWGWKYLGKFVYESDAKRAARELAKLPTYFETQN